LQLRRWVDVEDLFDYTPGNKRPSGIQRLAFKICRALQQRVSDCGLKRRL